MKLRVLPYVTVEVDDRLRRRLRSRGERLRLTMRAYLLSAVDDVDTASDKVRGLCDRAVNRVDSVVAGVNDKIAPTESAQDGRPAAPSDRRPAAPSDRRPAAGRLHLVSRREAS